MNVENQVRAELADLSSSVTGVEGCVVATSDGLLVAHVLPEQEQSQVAALISTLAAVARQAVNLTGRGTLYEAAIRGTTGYLAVYTLGDGAVLAILGRPELNIALLQLRTRPVVDRLTELAAGFTRFATGPSLIQAVLEESTGVQGIDLQGTP